MKSVILSIAILLYNEISVAQSVGIGTTSPHSSAQLDINSTTKGLLPPRMNLAQRNAIATPAAGLIIWCIDCDELQVYNGTIWKNMKGAAACVVVSFPNVSICNQVWMVKNLNVSTYRNGDSIPKVTDPTTWAALTTGAWCWYNNDSATYADTYGKLYNWYAMNDSRGLAPPGWHKPTDEEWTTLTTCLGGETVSGGPMKEDGTSHWFSPNTGATNSSGFTGLPGGYRSSNGTFYVNGSHGYWWSSTEFDAATAWFYNLYYNFAFTGRNLNPKTMGFSVRCIRD